jgi:RimJ/RimL family protein N-acetyltransferase
MKPQVILRALDEADLERTLRWHNDPALYANLGDGFRFVSRAAEAEWLRRKTTFTSDEVNLAVCLPARAEHIGNIYLREINWVARKATLHLFLGAKEHRGHGYGAQALHLILRHAFLDLNLHRIGLEVLADNAAAIKLYEKSGFATEGRLRDAAFKAGRHLDVLTMGILAHDFLRGPRSGKNP